MLTEQIVKGGFCVRGFSRFFFLSGCFSAEFGIQGKPVAEVGPLLVGRFFRIRLGTVSPRAGQEKTAMSAGPQILAAGTAHTPAQGLFFRYGCSAIPAHVYIITGLRELL